MLTYTLIGANLEAESTGADSLHWKILSGSRAARLIIWQIIQCVKCALSVADHLADHTVCKMCIQYMCTQSVNTEWAQCGLSVFTKCALSALKGYSV